MFSVTVTVREADKAPSSSILFSGAKKDCEDFANMIIASYLSIESNPVTGGDLGNWMDATLYFGSKENSVHVVTQVTR